MKKPPRSLLKVSLFFVIPLFFTWAIGGFADRGGTSPELKKRLTKTQYAVTQLGETEPAFRNEYFDKKDAGIYVDVVSGEPLFSSLDKYDSGTGWPSFTKPIHDQALVEKIDRQLKEERTEILSKGARSHLGHVFDDGPKDAGGKRYCMNSAALRFIPVKDLEKEGYGQYRALFEKKPAPKPATETAILAGGCFWGMEHILRKFPGVLDTNAVYAKGKTGTPEKAEAVEVIFDPSRTSYEKLLELFFKMHDPTTKNQQGNDIGPQYRSALFYRTPAQKKAAEDARTYVDLSKKWKKPVVTEIVELDSYTQAEDFHQDYLVKNPGGYTCHYVRD